MHADQYNFDDDDAQMTPRRMAGGMNYATDRRRRGSTHPPSHVLATRSQPLGLGEQSVRGPIALGPSAAAGRPLHFFNPSIAPSPPHLCRRCAYLATLRADVLHQCDTSTPLRSRLQGPTNGFFKGTALAALDADLAVLGWTWLLIDPGEQVLGRTDGRSNRSDYFVRRGSAGAFPPPWSAHAIDTRLHSFDGTHLLATFVRSCHARQPCSFGVSQLHVTAEPTPDGGLEQMRAWVHPTITSTASWAQGRSQALFSVPASASADGNTRVSVPAELYVMPWPGLVASFGVVAFPRKRLHCFPWAVRGQRPRRVLPWLRKLHRAQCGHSPAGTRLELDILDAKSSGVHGLQLIHNHTKALPRRSPQSPPLSLTAGLLRIERADGCAALLGVGHVHHTDGVRSQSGRPRDAQHGHAALPFYFGADYDHHFFTLSPRAPFTPLAYSRDFCLASAADPTDCERVQFISGLAHAAERAPVGGRAVLLAYGVNDCEARVVRLPLERVWEMLTPLPGVVDTCA